MLKPPRLLPHRSNKPFGRARPQRFTHHEGTDSLSGDPIPSDPKQSEPSQRGKVQSETVQLDSKTSEFVYFEGPITPHSIRQLHHAIIRLAEQRLPEITIVINSSGGSVTPTLQLARALQLFPVKIKTHGRGDVQSAANLLFLSGRHRSADRNTKFLFHPLLTFFAGNLDQEQNEQQIRQHKELEDAMATLFHDRTDLPSEAIERFKHETIVYDAETALRFGIIHEIRDLQVSLTDKISS